MCSHDSYTDPPVPIPSLNELKRMVIPTSAVDAPAAPEVSDKTPGHGSGKAKLPAPVPKPDVEPGDPSGLSSKAESLLRQAVDPAHADWPLEQHWQALGIDAGSEKRRLLNELKGFGFIRVERKGREGRVRVYRRGYERLGLTPPREKGIGGDKHRKIAKHIARLLTKSGFSEVSYEREIGPHRKRVDIVGYGKDGVVGVEIGLTDYRQELKNIHDDLRAAVLDKLLWVTTDPALLRSVREKAAQDPAIRPHLSCVRLFLLKDDWDEA